MNNFLEACKNGNIDINLNDEEFDINIVNNDTSTGFHFA
jgi:hypothetical protein